jgi:hypothetical protein
MRRLLLLTVLFTSLNYATNIIKEGQDYPIEKMKEQNREIIKMVVEEISKRLPQSVDSYTKLVKIEDKGLMLIYTFEINTGIKSDEAVIKEDEARMRRVVSKGICQSSKRFLDAGIDLSYRYQSALSKKTLFTFTMTQASCKELQL